ncbi:PhiH1 repressor-like protein [Natrinema altunense JCM 12890]|uniref:PhiH1 repressor-like protein n=2 Tax=Natrinema altunense TaxID=222984 RepID=L9ZGM6_NATA2|nr:winged helix-turn-helix domain-containing protein [Natrinema altunense]ELY84328.1 PhiH1 repressor-like protein [Natrinema altunense JCM 12890]
MRKSADWMSIADERILEALEEKESGTPTSLSQNEYVRFSRTHLHQRMKKLDRYGLIRFLGNGVYVLTDEGHQYLDGDLDAAELEPDED